jgi:hypothetical protein
MPMPEGWTTIQFSKETRDRFTRNKKREEQLRLITSGKERRIYNEDFLQSLMMMYETLVEQEKK